MQAFDCVADGAVEKAEHIISSMTEHMHPKILERLHQNGADVAVIGRDQVGACNSLLLHLGKVNKNYTKAWTLLPECRLIGRINNLMKSIC